MKSIAIKCFIGWVLSNFVMHMSNVAHQPMHSVWEVVLIMFITWGAIALVFTIHNMYKLHKERKETEAKWQEVVEKWKIIKESIEK